MEEVDTPMINGVSHASTKEKKDKERSKDKKEKKRKQRELGLNFQEPPSKQKKKHRQDAQRLPEKNHAPTLIDRSPFHQKTSSFYLPLSPVGQLHPLRTLCAEHFSPLLLTYYHPLHGVILSYSNPRLSASAEDATSADGRQKVYARSIDEYGAPFVWVTADFLVLNPQRGDMCEGYISIQNESSVGLICWNFFSASIERRRLPKNWRWISGGKPRKRKQKLKRPSQEDDMDIDDDHNDDGPQESQISTYEQSEGHYVDDNGEKVSGLIQFRVKDVDTSGSTSREFDFMSILGTMLSDEEERQMRKEEISQYLAATKGMRMTNGRRGSLGNQLNGLDGAVESESEETSRHRVSY